jgi:hypothetical protein
MKGTPLKKGEEVADTAHLPCFLCPRPTWPDGFDHCRAGAVIMASPLGPRFAKHISRRPTPARLFFFFLLFLSKFCQPQIHLSVFFPLFVLFVCSGAGLPLYLLIYISSSLTPKINPSTAIYTIKHSVAGQLETR